MAGHREGSSSSSSLETEPQPEAMGWKAVTARGEDQDHIQEMMTNQRNSCNKTANQVITKNRCLKKVEEEIPGCLSPGEEKNFMNPARAMDAIEVQNPEVNQEMNMEMTIKTT